MKTIILTVCSFLILAIPCLSQITHQFEQIGRNIEYGSTADVAVGAEGTVFVANGSGGLRAYQKDGADLIFLDLIDDGIIEPTRGTATAVASGPDNTVFLANDIDGLRAYRFENSTFSEAGYIFTFDRCLDVAVYDEETVLIANAFGGIHAYAYDGAAFSEIASVDTIGQALGLSIGPDNTIFLANGEGGLRAFEFDGASFTHKAQINDGGYTSSVTVDQENNVFIAAGVKGARSYSYNGSSFQNTAFTDDGGLANGLAVLSDNIILVTKGYDGLFAYNFTGNSFDYLNHVNDGVSASSVMTDSNGEIFLANGFDGLRTYSFTENVFSAISHTVHTGFAECLTFGKDSTLFLYNVRDGLRSYEFNGSSFQCLSHLDIEEFYGNWPFSGFSVDQNNTLYIPYQGLTAYQYSDTFEYSGHLGFPNNTVTIRMGEDSTLFVAGGPDGLRAYTFDGDYFHDAGYTTGTGYAYDVEIGNDGTIYLASGSNGIFVFSYEDGTFTEQYHLPFSNDAEAFGMHITQDSILYVAAGTRGVYALKYTGTMLTNLGRYDDYGSGIYACDVAAWGDSLVFLANGFDGLHAFVHDKESRTFLPTAKIDDGGEARYVEVGSDGTIFLANYDEGLIAYSYGPLTSIEPKKPELAAGYALSGNFPNPFNPETSFYFSLPKREHVTIQVYNMLGEKVQLLLNQSRNAGTHQVTFDGSGLPSGIYFYQMQAGEFTEVRKMILLR